MNSDPSSQYLCLKCQGECVRVKLKTPGLGEYVHVQYCGESCSRHSEELILGAWMCTLCGYIELYGHIDEFEDVAVK